MLPVVGPISGDDRRSSVSLLPSAILDIPSTGLMDLDLWTLAGPEPTSYSVPGLPEGSPGLIFYVDPNYTWHCAQGSSSSGTRKVK